MHYFHALCLFLYLKQKYEALLCDRGTIDRVAIHSIQCVGSGSWFVWFILSVFEHEQQKNTKPAFPILHTFVTQTLVYLAVEPMYYLFHFITSQFHPLYCKQYNIAQSSYSEKVNTMKRIPVTQQNKCSTRNELEMRFLIPVFEITLLVRINFFKAL